MQNAFDCDRYLVAQVAAFQEKLALAPAGGRVFIEFGGKIVDDHHAARVLPGYHPDAKIELLRYLSQDFAVVVVVAARDILKPRIRGDTQLFYDLETVRLVNRLRELGVPVHAGVVSMVEEDHGQAGIDKFVRLAKSSLGIDFARHPKILGYPDPAHVLASIGSWDETAELAVPRHRNVLVLSPGGGSGKFGICLAELYADYKRQVNSFYIKFETFPVFALPYTHPVNLAFVAATADLGNKVLKEAAGELTTYDKDAENFKLLYAIHQKYCPDLPANPITGYRRPSDMGVNKILEGFEKEARIKQAALREIARRANRYTAEIKRGIEVEATLQHLYEQVPMEVTHV